MPKLAFIYAKKFYQAKWLASLIFFVTISALCYLLFIKQSDVLATLIAMMLIASLGGYIHHIIASQALSFTLSQTHIQYHSLRGGWSIAWHKIQRIDLPRISVRDWQKTLPWVGIRLKSYEPMLDSISFRLASQLLIEQRGLLLTGFRYSAKPEHELEKMLFDDKPFIARNGKIYKGLLAMLANRMCYTRELLGFDIFIDENLLDRPPEDFVGFTRRYLAESFRSD